MTPLSICMTMRNRANLLGRSLASLCFWNEFEPAEAELVVVDDCSEDQKELHRVLETFAPYFSRTVLVHMDKRLSKIPVVWNCPALGINLAVREARNEIILKLDPECLPLGNAVRDAAAEYREDRVCFFSVRMLTEVETAFFDPRAVSSEHPLAIYEKKLVHLSGPWDLYDIDPIHHRYGYWFGAVFSKARFLRIGGVDEEFLRGFAGEDDDWYERMVRSGALAAWPHELRILHQWHGNANRAYHMSPAHLHNIALLDQSRRANRIVANVGYDWGAESAITGKEEFLHVHA